MKKGGPAAAGSGMFAPPGSSGHQPPSSSACVSGAQNSNATPLSSWYQAGKPPTRPVGTGGGFPRDWVGFPHPRPHSPRLCSQW